MKLITAIIKPFKLDEVREADILVHVADISHPAFEEQINVVRQTLADIKASDKPTIMVFNKTDAYRFIEKEADDLTPPTKENLTLEELEKTWMAREHLPSLFISATNRDNIDKMRETLYNEVRKIVVVRYPENQG